MSKPISAAEGILHSLGCAQLLKRSGDCGRALAEVAPGIGPLAGVQERIPFPTGAPDAIPPVDADGFRGRSFPPLAA